ncbi:MAG: RluA family pseudouridine synthase [Clostridia bacterium]|nr:RluA family pseudouridine synthase [Clostridia bacterium]
MDIIINNNYEGKLIREVLKNDLGFSVNLIKKLKFSEDGIRVNGQWVTVRYELKHGDILSLATEDRADDVSPYIIPADLPIDVLYEDEFVTAVGKPYNMPSHPSHGHRLDTVANALAYRYADRTYVFRPVNRLDRDTSGCMLTSNTKDASFKMYSAMVEGAIHKTYLAVLDGVLPMEEGEIFSYVRRREESIIEREECSPALSDAKPALTVFRRIAVSEDHTLVIASPITGRTHQLRLHFLGKGCPITGDSLYGSENEHISRHALHSWKTTFPHPYSGQIISVTAPIPADIAALMDAYSLHLSDDESLLDLTGLIQAAKKPITDKPKGSPERP